MYTLRGIVGYTSSAHVPKTIAHTLSRLKTVCATRCLGHMITDKTHRTIKDRDSFINLTMELTQTGYVKKKTRNLEAWRKQNEAIVNSFDVVTKESKHWNNFFVVFMSLAVRRNADVPVLRDEWRDGHNANVDADDSRQHRTDVHRVDVNARFDPHDEHDHVLGPGSQPAKWLRAARHQPERRRVQPHGHQNRTVLGRRRQRGRRMDAARSEEKERREWPRDRNHPQQLSGVNDVHPRTEKTHRTASQEKRTREYFEK